MKQIVLIDGKYLAYKMYFSHLGLRSSDRKPTGLLHGFLGEILRLNRQLPEAHIMVCWDGEKTTWRHKIFPSYKANRTVSPQTREMYPQIELLLPLLRQMGLWVLQLDDVEADDMIGMVARHFSDRDYEVRIYSKDRDMFQLADEHIWMWPDPKNAPLKRIDIEKWLGAPFSALTEIRAMSGDSGDNLKGLPGVGMVTAVKLWKQGLRFNRSFNASLHAKYKPHWNRVKVEYECAKIVTDPLAEVWPEETSKKLVHLLYRLKVRPGRNVKLAEENRRDIYRFFARYELKSLLESRQKFFQLP